MKRISLWLVLLALTPGIAEAWNYYVPPRYRVHYSPYALSYHSSGLVPGGLDYSMHRVDYHNSGLVLEGVRYTPYALNYNHSGLVRDYYPISAYAYPAYRVVYAVTQSACRVPCCSARDTNSGTRPALYTRSIPRGKPRKADGMDIIRQQLRAKGINAPHINRILSIDKKLVSVDFMLADRKLLIKYWNPDATKMLDAAEGSRRKAYEKYKRNWESFAAQFEQGGGEIFYVTASDAQTIVAALDSCTKLDGKGTPTRPRMYAKN
jgi:hypothetical protein